MRQGLFLFILFIIFTMFGCSDMLDKTGSDGSISGPSSDTTIDARSSASKKFKLKGGSVYSSGITINFWYLFSNGDTWALILDENGDTVVCDTLNGDPFYYPENNDNQHILEPLKPSSNYSLIMDGLWQGSNRWPLDTVYFTTRKDGFAIPESTVLDTTIIDTTPQFDPFVDGITSASKKFKLNSGTVKSTSLDINFWYKYDNGFTWALVIDENGDTAVCDTLNVYPFDYISEVNHNHSLDKLIPNSPYKLIMSGFWDDDGYLSVPKSWPLDTVPFTTLP